MTPRDFADTYLHPYRVHGDELVPQYCPFCHGGDKRDKHTFALNAVKETYNCKRGKCGRQGTYAELLRGFGINGKTYKAPEVKPRPATPTAIEYLRLRKISAETAKLYGVGTDDSGNLMFPYYDEKGVHVFNKFRLPRKLRDGERKAWREAGTKPVLFGMHLCNPENPLTICEGEIDALSCREAGILNAVSVPSGAEDFTWIDTCWDFLQKYKRVHLFGDNDPAGREMIRKVAKRLPGAKVFIVEHLEKDANLLLFRHGPEAVYSAWEQAREMPIAGLINLADVVPLDVAKMRKVCTSIVNLNRMLGGFMMGDVSVWTGKRGEGKSTLLSQVLLDAIDDGKKVCAYSGELSRERFQYWTDIQAAGPEHIVSYFDKEADAKVWYVPAGKRDQIHDWYDGRYWLYDNAIVNVDEEATVLRVFEQAAKRHGCEVFLIDNLMTVDFGRMPEKDFYLQQTRFINQVAAFANAFNVHVHLVAHPRKQEGKNRDIDDSDEVGGSGNITNRVANVIAVSRAKAEIGFDTSVTVLKNRWQGRTGSMGLVFDEKSKRLSEPSHVGIRQYGWERMNFVEMRQENVFGEEGA